MLIEAYFDDSGSHQGAPVSVVGGYIFRQEQAERLDREWIAKLREYGIESFHAADFSNAQRPFDRLSLADRADLMKGLIGIINRRMESGVLVYLSDTDFGNSAKLEFLRGSPILPCAAFAVLHVVKWFERTAVLGDCHYFFEGGEKSAKSFDEFFSSIIRDPAKRDYFRYAGHSFIKKSEEGRAGPIQAADLWAYEGFKELCRVSGWRMTKPRGPRQSLAALLLDGGVYYQSRIRTEDILTMQSGGDGILKVQEAPDKFILIE